MTGWTDGGMDRRMDGWIDEWLDGWMDGNYKVALSILKTLVSINAALNVK